MNKDLLVSVCLKFVKDHEITCVEGIYQMDDVSLAALEFIESICGIVGYHIREEEVE